MKRVGESDPATSSSDLKTDHASSHGRGAADHAPVPEQSPDTCEQLMPAYLSARAVSAPAAMPVVDDEPRPQRDVVARALKKSKVGLKAPAAGLKPRAVPADKRSIDECQREGALNYIRRHVRVGPTRSRDRRQRERKSTQKNAPVRRPPK